MIDKREKRREKRGGKWLFKFLSIFFLFAFCSILFPVFAQQIALSISPPLIELVAKPGKSVLVAYKIQNFGDPSVFRTRVVSFIPKDTSGQIITKEDIEGPVRFSLDNADIQLTDPFFLQTRESQQILLRIRIPDGAPEGDYYYTLLAENEPVPQAEGSSASRAQARVGSNILVTVTDSGRVDIKGRIALFDVLSRFKFHIFGREFRIFDSSDKIPVILMVGNLGKNLIKPDGEIVLKGNFGEKAKYNVVPQNILAYSQRLIEATPSAEVDCDAKNQQAYCKRPVSLIISGFFLGRYRLSTNINFGEGSTNVFGETSFVALPLKFGLAILGILIVVTFILKRIRKDKES